MTRKRSTEEEIATQKAQNEMAPRPRTGLGGRGSINLEERGQPLAPAPRELAPDPMAGQGMIARKMGLLQEIARMTGLNVRDAATQYEGLDEGQLQDVLRQLGY